MENQQHILLVEDEQSLSDWIAEYLTMRGFKVTQTARGDEAVTLIQSLNPDLVLLDGMLPGMDGVDVCKTVRPEFTNAIIMITARDEEADEVLGLEMGADDFLVKPIRARALLSRIKILLNKQNQTSIALSDDPLANDPSNDNELRFNKLIINASTRQVTLADEQINLSTKEFDVLWLLANSAGQVVSREQLVTDLRGFEYDGFDRSIDLQVSRLRKKLNGKNVDKSTDNQTDRIKTIWGKGYLFVKDVW
ncbi:response regulator transcription factor [Psychrosphaera sp. F3M07]|uniref:response regulator transcription factor n=1 Tax=Psychrosphaera sp. F3M07 TaxID=2841560 RepID=UPI001C09E883|nr:response regulator transcription factor [Psychrosphaera sp. F3M07]MBU2918254.1 response regulator transcription factor [Psychrosphaera sp. F3M07]